jgi:hypothetical protein
MHHCVYCGCELRARGSGDRLRLGTALGFSANVRESSVRDGSTGLFMRPERLRAIRGALCRRSSWAEHSESDPGVASTKRPFGAPLTMEGTSAGQRRMASVWLIFTPLTGASSRRRPFGGLPWPTAVIGYCENFRLIFKFLDGFAHSQAPCAMRAQDLEMFDMPSKQCESNISSGIMLDEPMRASLHTIEVWPNRAIDARVPQLSITSQRLRSAPRQPKTRGWSRRHPYGVPEFTLNQYRSHDGRPIRCY